ncbi:PTS ascorbate transporter subunit IIC [Spiroplasma sp. DGKH1]|uniref:PTS ascorbate transporter subunit IIC n=1 Tax=Spiroplasma sp. DGKH1 TaxID=3050074 RepID=UPI0034C5C28E
MAKDKELKAEDKNDLDNPMAGSTHLTAPKKRPYLAVIITWTSIGIILVAFIASALATNHPEYLKWVFYDGFVNNILAVPSILIGLITFLGYLLQKKKWYEALAGAFKAIVGYIVLQIGSYILTGISKPLMQNFGKKIGASTILLDPYMGWTAANKALGEVVSIVSYIVLLGLFINILLVALKRITNIHSINVTGHIMFQQSAVIAVVLYLMMFGGIIDTSAREIATIIIGGVLMGLYWGVFSNLAINPTNKVTNNAGFTVGHQQMLGVWVAYNTGKLFARKGKPVRSAEDLKLPKGLKIFHDNIFSSSILMLIFFGALFIILYCTDETLFNATVAANVIPMNQFTGKFWLLQVIGLSFEIVASLQILMQGARMFVVELQKSFIGISKKLIPGAVVAIDIAGTFAFGEKAVVYGFLSGAIGNFIGIALIILFGQVGHFPAFNVVIMVGFIAMFFDNGAIGLYSDKSGGWKACLTLPFLSGIIICFGAVLAVQMAPVFKGGVNGNNPGYLGMWDWDILWAVILMLINVVGVNSAPYMLILIIPIFLLIAQLTSTELTAEMPLKRIIKSNRKLITKVENENIKANKMDN